MHCHSPAACPTAAGMGLLCLPGQLSRSSTPGSLRAGMLARRGAAPALGGQALRCAAAWLLPHPAQPQPQAPASHCVRWCCERQPGGAWQACCHLRGQETGAPCPRPAPSAAAGAERPRRAALTQAPGLSGQLLAVRQGLPAAGRAELPWLPCACLASSWQEL